MGEELEVAIPNHGNIQGGKKILCYLPQALVDDLKVIMHNTYAKNRSEVIRQILANYAVQYKSVHPEWFSTPAQPQREAVCPCSTTPLETPSE